jgi:triosephosphate isomerase (TIM)
MKYIIANWKANKTLLEATQWIKDFIPELEKLRDLETKVTIIICPPFPLLSLLKNMTEEYDYIHIGAQDVSSSDAGPMTGEVSAKLLNSLVSYTLVGHSSRRMTFGETEEMIQNKITQAKKYAIEPILCVRNNEDMIYDEVSFVAYEPVAAIGSGNNEGVPETLAMKKQLNLKPGTKYLYGGSVKPDNTASYLQSPEIDGLLVGSASLDPHQFAAIIAKV